MLSSKEIVCPNNLLDLAHKKKGVKVAVVNAGKPLPMLSIQDAVNESLIEPIFIGHEVEILKCAEDIKWDISKYELIHEPVENDTAKIAAKLAIGSLFSKLGNSTKLANTKKPCKMADNLVFPPD